MATPVMYDDSEAISQHKANDPGSTGSLRLVVWLSVVVSTGNPLMRVLEQFGLHGHSLTAELHVRHI